ncbi:amidohydrolase [Actinoplanes sp. NPDC051343]|uniref:amidohydrolase n=1 Tax=Actinoplanes sp. NPDC051343 TaxID=3363906 RepID=UPI0037B7D702
MATAYAEKLFTSGPVFTAGRTTGAQVAVRDGRVVAVGPDLAGLAGPATERIDLAGRLLIPGFQDAHIHAVMAGVELGQCDLTGTVDRDEYRRRIRAYADAHPEAEWITGGGWSMESFENGVPDRRILDELVPDRPVYLMNRDHHAGWANSRALEWAGITAETSDPADGRIDRDARGEPVGGLQEGAMSLVAAVVPPITAAVRLSGLMRAQELLHSLGITAWQDAMLCATNGYADVSDAYLEMARTGALTATVVGALWWDRDRGAEQIPELVAKRDAMTIGRLRCDSVKLMLDGIAENFTAAMTAPYRDSCGHATGNAGLSFIDPDRLPEYVAALDRLGFQPHFHALGDRAVRDGLNAVERARRENGVRDTRPHLAHLQVVHPDDVPRFAALGAVANIQALWATHEPQMDDLTLPFLDPELGRRQYPFGDLHRAGARLAAGSDWPVSSPDPIQGMHVAVNRVLRGTGREPFLPEQRLSLEVALEAYTAGSAFVNHLDDTGCIEPGFRADLAVLDRDPFAGPPEEIGEARVDMTLVDGKAVFTRE